MQGRSESQHRVKLIVGLGNPGRQYRETRHNVGFLAVDLLAESWRIEVTGKKHKALYGRGRWQDHSVVLLKPQTYMNRSGESVLSAMSFYKVLPSDIFVILDDIALPPGQLRIRQQGSSGGHNGLRDIIRHLGRDDICRLRIGIGSAESGQAVEHVLGNFIESEKQKIEDAVRRARGCVEYWLIKGIQAAMTKFNRKVEQEEDET
jgi:PTH1 family peptidyl-tRNA hydrolase